MKLLHVTLLLCAVMALTSAKCRSRCPPGWMQHHARCYKYIGTKMTWADAEKNCLAQCGNLVSINDATENSIVGAMAQANQNSVWIGGHDHAQEGFWFWSDGTKMTHTKWAKREPNNAGIGGQDCIQMYSNGQWDDYFCGRKKSSICVKSL